MWLKELREQTGKTQKEMAQTVGINRATLSKLETGSMKPSVGLAKSLGGVLNFDWTRFYDADPDENKLPEKA